MRCALGGQRVLGLPICGRAACPALVSGGRDGHLGQLLRGERETDRLDQVRALPHHEVRSRLPLLAERLARVGPRHRTHARGPAENRLHATGRGPRHVRARLPQRHAVDQPPHGRGGSRTAVVHIRWRVTRPRRPAHRVPLAHDWPLEPSELWFTPHNGRTWTTRQLTNDPTGYSIRPVTPRGLTGANRILYVRGDERTIGFTNYRTRVHALDF